MKKLLRVLTSLYPKSWRERYGDEFAALLDDIEPRWSDVVNLIVNGMRVRSLDMKAWTMIAGGALLGLVVHTAVLFHIPDNYTSVALVNYSNGAVGSVDEREVMHLVDAALTDQQVAKIMKTYGPYDRLRTEGRDNEATALFRRDVRFSTRRIEQRGNIPVLRVAYSDGDPIRAQYVTRDILYAVFDKHIQTHFENGADPNVNNQEDEKWKGMKLEVLDLPNLPPRSNRWASAPWTLGSGVLAGLGFGGGCRASVRLAKTRRKILARCGADVSIIDLCT